MIIAIDGPAGSGKSTTARGVAELLTIMYLDTGAMYRALTWALIDAGVEPTDNEKVYDYLKKLDINFDSSNHILVNSKDISHAIRTRKVSSQVSAVSTIPKVRAIMVEIQRKFVGNNDCVLEGRDIGTVVFPEADFKFFLVADATIRAKRRMKDFKEIGENAIFSDILADIEKRDANDSSRTHSPLIKADDAIIIDTSYITIDQQIEKIVNLIKKTK